jgi:hypothetical protein
MASILFLSIASGIISLLILGNYYFTYRHTERFRQVQLLKSKERQKEEAMHIEDTQRLVTGIEMLKVVLYLVVRKERSS